MSKLSIKQKKAGAVNVYEVKLTLHVHHQSALDARSYVTTALQDWAVNGICIPSVQFDSIQETEKRFFVAGVVYPEDVDAVEELR
jgi:hypothetical protein